MKRLSRRVVGISVLFAALSVLASACAEGAAAEDASGPETATGEHEEAEHIHPDFDMTFTELEEQLAGAATELHPAFGERFAPR
ncbi:MAG: hypothetical protein GVY29_01320, partial [Spirochaetes bacterium]|nr:hypothetical protein [Spirochaetota bacterium]